MTLTPYVYPSIAGIAWHFEGGPARAADANTLSYEADAQAYAKAIGARCLNAATLPGFVFSGLDPNGPAQPWIVRWNDNDPIWFAGQAINQQVQATFQLIGVATAQYPGTWTEATSGAWLFVPNPIVVAPTPPPAPPAAPGSDAAAWNQFSGAGELTQLQRDQVLIAIAAAVGVKVPV